MLFDPLFDIFHGFSAFLVCQFVLMLCCFPVFMFVPIGIFSLVCPFPNLPLVFSLFPVGVLENKVDVQWYNNGTKADKSENIGTTQVGFLELIEQSNDLD